MSLVIFCLLFSSVDYVSVKGEIIRYLSLSAWLISLSIMLSSFIHAVAKGISSFFLSPFLYFLIILLLFNYSCPHLPSTTPLATPAKPISLPCFHTHPRFCPCVLYSCSWKLFRPLSPSTSPLVTIRLFLISMSLVCFACLFVLLIRFHLKVKSHGICLSLLYLFHLA